MNRKDFFARCAALFSALVCRPVHAGGIDIRNNRLVGPVTVGGDWAVKNTFTVKDCHIIEPQFSALEQAIQTEAEQCKKALEDVGSLKETRDAIVYGKLSGLRWAQVRLQERDAKLYALLYDLEHYPAGEWSRRLRAILDGEATDHA